MLGLTLAATASAAVIEVPADQPTIQAGVSAAADGDEVVVAPGLYEEFVNLEGKSITVRSSGGAVVTTIDATSVIDPGGGNSVFRAHSGETGAVIEGFTITGGTGALDGLLGGGLYANGSSLTVRDCVFAGNAARISGGAIFVESGDVLVERCSFLGNDADSGGAITVYNGALRAVDSRFEGNSAAEEGAAGDGGAIEAFGSGTLILERCDFIDNFAGVPNATEIPTPARGGAIFLTEMDLQVSNCRFFGNSAVTEGGAVFVAGGATASFTDCLFSGNVAANSGGTAAGRGGALFVSGGTTDVANCTFSANQAMLTGGGVMCVNDSLRVVNSVLWGNSDQNGTGAASQLTWLSGSLSATHSIVMGGLAGTANLDADPLFVDADGTDDVAGTEDDDLRLAPGSPAIDSGDTVSVVGLVDNEDLDLNPRVTDDAATADTGIPIFNLAVIDRGPYEYAGTSPLQQCQADLAQCSTDEVQCGLDLDQCSSDLDACLAAPPLDTDADGEPDASDACASTPAAEPVDSAGCSHAEFCSGFDTSDRDGRRACRRADWGNGEPARTRPRDCMVQRDPTGGVSVCVVREE